LARTLVTPTPLVAGVGLASGAGTTIDSTLVTNGVYVAAGGDLSRILLRVTNTNGTARVLTIHAAEAETGYPFGYNTFMGGQGDFTLSVTATTGDFLITGLEAARFYNIDPTTLLHGALLVDFATSFAGVFYAYKLPKGIT
jgi:hypothetical protein